MDDGYNPLCNLLHSICHLQWNTPELESRKEKLEV